MPTSSFEKRFVVSDPKAIETLLHALDNPQKIRPVDRDYQADRDKGIELFKRSLAVEETTIKAKSVRCDIGAKNSMLTPVTY